MKQAKVLTKKDINKVLTYLSLKKHSSRNRCMWMFSYLAGMRVGEIASLRLCDVLDKEGKIKTEIYLSANQTKGVKGRTVVLSNKMRDEVDAYLKNRFRINDLLAVTMTDTTRALFNTQKSFHRGFTASTACQMMNSWYQEALGDGSSHSGRRSFITNLANKGVSVRILQELAGHSSLSVTQRYIDVNQSLLRSSVELL
jgi:integrase/recombinase XerD